MLIFLNISFCKLIIKLYINTQHFLVFEISKRRYQYCLCVFIKNSKATWDFLLILSKCALPHMWSDTFTLLFIQRSYQQIFDTWIYLNPSLSCKQVIGKVEMDSSLLNKQIHVISETTFCQWSAYHAVKSIRLQCFTLRRGIER